MRKKEFKTGRPKFDIGHHVNAVTFETMVVTVNLHGGKQFLESTERQIEQNDNVSLEFQESSSGLKSTERPAH